jgi:tetratricopeptide (TPR) repeat protein
MLQWLKAKFAAPPVPRGELLREAENAYREGALDQARQCCLAALRQSPDDARALFLMASVAADAKQIDDGLQWARRAIRARPRDASAHYALGRVWEAAGRYAEAESSYRASVALDPTNAKAHNNLGAVLHIRGRLEEALDCYRKALQLDPAQPQANQNYAAIVNDPGAQQAAIEGYLRQTAANQNDAAAFRHLANVYFEQGRKEEALAGLERAIALEPDDANSHFAKASLLLSLGKYAEGWKEYEWRWRTEAFKSPAVRFPQPMWDGDKLDAQVLMHGETGFGDMLQFVRYAPLVAQRCAGVILECQPQLKSLLAGLDGVTQLVAQGEPLPPFAAHIPLIRLPHVFGTTLEDIPWRGAYVHADSARIAEWRAALQPGAGLKVGLAWTGNPQNLGNPKRSITLAELAPLARVPGVRFYSLQKGAGAEQAVAASSSIRLVDLTGRIRDFSDTAALIELLDVVITIDTSIAHLAGALAVPTWVMLSHSPDWRYHLERSDNPWYPTMRLFRQPRASDWASVVEQVSKALAERSRF